MLNKIQNSFEVLDHEIECKNLNESLWIYISLFKKLKLWDALRHFETLWDALRHFETLWDALRRFKTLWDTLKHFEMLWDALRPLIRNESLWVYFSDLSWMCSWFDLNVCCIHNVHNHNWSEFDLNGLYVDMKCTNGLIRFWPELIVLMMWTNRIDRILILMNFF